MIEVLAKKNFISVVGHSGYAENGKDIVCAGVTALTQTLVQSIVGLTKDNPEYKLDPGIFCMELKDLSEESRLLVDSFFIGLCSIANEFPDHVRIK